MNEETKAKYDAAEKRLGQENPFARQFEELNGSEEVPESVVAEAFEGEANIDGKESRTLSDNEEQQTRDAELNEKAFNPELAYTTAVQEDKNNSLQNHIVENVDYTKPNGAAYQVLEELIGGETVEKI